jgi:hypothetical protein
MTEQDKTIIQAYQNFFESDSGKIVLNDLKERFGFRYPCYDERIDGKDGITKLIEMARADAQKEIILHIQGVCAVEKTLNAKGEVIYDV